MLTYTEDTQEDKKNHIKPVPIAVVGDLKENEFTGAVGIHGLKGDGGAHGADKGTEHGFEGEKVGEFLDREEDSTDGGTKGDRDTSGSGSGDNFTTADGILAEFNKESGGKVTTSTGNVDEGALLADAKAGTDGEDEALDLDEHLRGHKEPGDLKPGKEGTDLGDSTSRCVPGVVTDKEGACTS